MKTKSQQCAAIAAERERILKLWEARPQLTARHAARVFRSAYEAALILLLGGRPKSLGFSASALVKWRKAYKTGGVEALEFRKSSGRPPRIVLTKPDRELLRYYRLKKRSLRLAVEEALASEKLSAVAAMGLEEILALARVTRREPQWPLVLKRLCSVTKEEEALERGGRMYQNFEVSSRRLMAFKDEDSGELVQLGALDLYESDDESENGPFWWHDPTTGESLLGRQTLKTISVQAAGWLGFSHVGRERDAYRAEDIAEHMLSIVQTWGLPLAWRLEKGIWNSSFIHGVTLPPKLSKAAGVDRWGGLDALFKVMNVVRSRTKGTVEGGFNHLQSLAAHETPDMGRIRGENERVTKLLMKAYRGDADALAQFPHITEKAALMNAILERFNNEQKRRAWLGGEMVSPAELLQEATPRPMPEREAWRFLPVKRIATVQSNGIRATVPHYGSFEFLPNGATGLCLPHGYTVLIAFHPARPDQGCQLFNGVPLTDRINREGYAFGQYLGCAPMMKLVPQFGPVDEEQLRLKKASNASHRSLHRSYKNTAGQGTSLSIAQTRLGERYEIRTGPEAMVDRAAAAAGGREAALTPDGGPVRATEGPVRGVAPASPPARRRVRDLNTMSRAEMMAELARRQEAEEAAEAMN